jgi:hypothetical protein
VPAMGYRETSAVTHHEGCREDQPKVHELRGSLPRVL